MYREKLRNMCFCFLLSTTAAYGAPFVAVPLDTMVELKWSPSEGNSHFGAFLIRRSTEDFPKSAHDGDFVYLGKNIHLAGVNSDRGLKNDTEYFYTLFVLDRQGHEITHFTQKALPTKMPTPINHIRNGNFNSGLDNWEKRGGSAKIAAAEGLRGNCMVLSSQEAQDAIYRQTTKKSLKPKTLYTCACAIYDPSGTGAFSISNGIQNEQQASFCCPKRYGYGPIKASGHKGNAFWQERRFVFWTGEKDDPRNPFDGSVTLTLSVSGKHASSAKFADIRIIEGVMPMPAHSIPTHPVAYEPKLEVSAREWTFENGLDFQQWRIAKTHNSLPENFRIDSDGNLVITAWGNQAAQKKRSGGNLYSRDYFGSGRYDCYAKIGPAYDKDGNVVPPDRFQGCVFAFWNYNYLSYKEGQPEWYDDPSPIRNSEIDWELPGSYHSSVEGPCPIISWKHARCNTYGGQKGGDENVQVSLRPAFPPGKNVIDGNFHQFTTVWNSGIERADGTREPGYVEWYIDTGTELKEDHLLTRWKGETYGFDNIPFRCMHIVLTAWFPHYPPGSLTAKKCPQESWAGNADWEKTEFTIKKVQYTPLFNKANRDSWQPDTMSASKYWTP